MADPESYEVNRLQVSNASLPGTTLTLGRQRIVLDDQRFVGNAGWRQNEQTYDAVRAVNKSVKNPAIDVSYLNQVNRVFGPESPQGRYHGDGFLANVAYQFPIGKLVGFGYWLDFDPLTRFPELTAAQAAALNPVRVSTETHGVRFAGERPLQKFRVGYLASYAQQADYGSNPFQLDLDYYAVELTGGYSQYGLVLGVEVLEGNGVVGFSTPLATLHKFNGRADKFLTTSANGLDDRYVGISYAAKAISVLDSLSAAVSITSTKHSVSTPTSARKPTCSCKRRSSDCGRALGAWHSHEGADRLRPDVMSPKRLISGRIGEKGRATGCAR